MKQAPVILEDYNPSWPDKFTQEKDHLLEIIGVWNYGDIEHIGSTAIPDMVAKPVIDIMFGVKSLDDSLPAINRLIAHGYEYYPYRTDVMHWFCKPSDAFRTHHLHLVPYNSPLWNERIKFRELLKTNQSMANQYASLKKELAKAYRDDRETYTDKKWPFIQQALLQCN